MSTNARNEPNELRHKRHKARRLLCVLVADSRFCRANRHWSESGDSSTSLDDEHRFVIDAVFFAKLPEMIIVSRRVLQQRIANVSCGLPLVFSDHGFEVLPFFFVSTVIDAVGIKKEKVARAHQSNFGDIGRGRFSRPRQQ